MTDRNSVRESVQKYRNRMRNAGFRLVQMWVPDTRAEGFAEECRRQSDEAARHQDVEHDVMDWVESNADSEGWTP